MKILITGPRGFIASHLLSAMKETPSFEVITLDREQNLSDLPKFFEKHSFDAIIHLATLFLKSHQYEQIESLIESNLTLTSLLLDCCKKFGVKKFIAFGTYYEFPKPASLYAATKAAMNPIMEYYCQSGEMDVIELSIYDSYGPRDKRPKVLNFLLDAAFSKKEIPLSPGHQKLKLSNVSDICSAIIHVVKLVRRDNEKFSVAHFAIEPQKALTLREIAKKVEEVTKMKINAKWGALEYVPGVQMDPQLPYPPIPGWTAQISLDQGLVELVKTC